MNTCKRQKIGAGLRLPLPALLVLAVIFSGCSMDGGDDGGVNVPDALKMVIGRGYDITGAYAYSPEIKEAVLDLNQLIKDGRIVRDPNLRTGVFESYSGSTISEYQQSLAVKVSQSANAGVEGLGSFSSEIGGNFTMSRAQSDEYAFATSTSQIIKDAYIIQDRDWLTNYITDAFVADVKNRTPAQVIAKYGTHIMLGGVLGARLDYHMSAKKKGSSTGTEIGAYAKTRAEATLEGITVGGGGAAAVDNQFSNDFETTSVEVKTKVFGGTPELGQSIQNEQDYDAWIASIEGNEIWSDYYPNSLIPIWDLVGSNRWPEDTGDTYRMGLFEAYNNYFVGKKINVAASTRQSFKIWTSDQINKGNGADVFKIGNGDSQVNSKNGRNTYWELTVDLSLRADKDIDATFVYDVWENEPDYTHLKLERTLTIDMGGRDIIRLEGRTSQPMSGTIAGQTHDYNVVQQSGGSGDLLQYVAVRIDGNSTNDEGEIGVSVTLNLNFTERVN
jgi:hypothetical protein